MKKVSDKRAAELRHYDRVKKELEKELKELGNWFCFFSGIPLPPDSPLYPHHLVGKENDLLIDKDNLVPCLWEYHRKWHDEPLSKLKNEWWFDGFMERLKLKNRNCTTRHLVLQMTILEPFGRNQNLKESLKKIEINLLHSKQKPIRQRRI